MGLFSSSTDTSTRSGINVAPETGLEKQATNTLAGGLTGLEGIVNAGAGSQQVGAAVGAQQQYADLLGQLGQGNGLLQAQQAGIGGYTELGNQLYGGLMRQQTAQAQQMAARQGRGMNDLMMQNKLGQQRNDLVGSFAAQQAMAAPGQQAQYMGQRADVMQGLASQAMANRQALLSSGSSLRESDRSYRINTGEKYSNSSVTSNPSMMSNLGAIASIAGTVMGGPLGGMIGGGLSKMFSSAPSQGAGYEIGQQPNGATARTGIDEQGNSWPTLGGGFGGQQPQQQQYSAGGGGSVNYFNPPAGQPAGPNGYDPFSAGVPQGGFFSQQNVNGFQGMAQQWPNVQQLASPGRQSMLTGRGY